MGNKSRRSGNIAGRESRSRESADAINSKRPFFVDHLKGSGRYLILSPNVGENSRPRKKKKNIKDNHRKKKGRDKIERGKRGWGIGEGGEKERGEGRVNGVRREEDKERCKDRGGGGGGVKR